MQNFSFIYIFLNWLTVESANRPFTRPVNVKNGIIRSCKNRKIFEANSDEYTQDQKGIDGGGLS